MAKEILKTSDLFRIKGQYVIAGTKIETGVNQFSNDPDTFSVSRPSRSATSPSKISILARLFGRINEIAFLEATTEKMVVIESHNNFIMAKLLDSGDIEIKSTFDCIKKDVWVAVAALASSKPVRTTELENCCAAILREMTLPFMSDNVIKQLNLFCDSVYFEMLRNHEIELEAGTLTMEELQTAYNVGYLTMHSMFDFDEGSENLAAPTSLTKMNSVQKHVSQNFDSFIDDAKSGMYKIEYDWSDEQKAHVQPKSFLDNFVASSQFVGLTKKIKHRLDQIKGREEKGMNYIDMIGKDYINALMVGKPGTGKTTLAYALSAATGLPVYTTAITHNTEETEFSGITAIVDGKPQFCSTDFLDAYKNGGIILLEEINLANPSVLMGGLGQAIEAPFIIKENGYKDVRRHPLCVIIGTMNVGTAGSKPLNAAFANRFKQTYTLEDPDRDSFVKWLELSTTLDRNACVWVHDVYTNIVNILSDPDLDSECDKDDVIAGLSVRTCMGALECMEEGADCWGAIEDSLIGAIARQDLALARDVFNTITGSIRPLEL